MMGIKNGNSKVNMSCALNDLLSDEFNVSFESLMSSEARR